MDRVNPVVRSKVMGTVRSTGTQLEMRLAEVLRRVRLTKFEQNPHGIPGRPDFAFRKKRIAVFVDSCFWHRCRWHCRMPASNRRYWVAKIERNRVRDKQVTASLKRQGWVVIRIWEHNLNEQKKINAVIIKLKWVIKGTPYEKRKKPQ